jgi:activator of 2-hydroxyglutaryl-CoA dehydratase/predicted nucleotide-binding protein (sugar kinase/HSP70/actin superfamily)
MDKHAIGIDIGAETIKLVEARSQGSTLEIVRIDRLSHLKDPHGALASLFSAIDHADALRIAATGRLARVLQVEQVPTKAAIRRGVRLLHQELDELTVLSIGAHGFCVLELSGSGQEWFQQNSRCSQGTGNFLSQLVERFGMTVDEASALCDGEPNPAALSGRCPVILKTDMTHLANKGEDRSRILAGLYDAVCENVLSLVRPRLAPPNVVLIGGVSRAPRIRRKIGQWLEQHKMHLVDERPEDQVLEAIGAMSYALELEEALNEQDFNIRSLLVTSRGAKLERTPALGHSLASVQRMAKGATQDKTSGVLPVILGLDIGSTGSKLVATEIDTGEAIWQTYLDTEGAPVRAAQGLVRRFTESDFATARVLGFGVTGSGREVVGSLLRTCYSERRVFVLNEIAAHARGAVSVDPEVDTIFEIGGQDAKYIRLEGGRVVDAAMNEACSAGTGSFIAEQGRKFESIGVDPVRLGQVALEAEHGISLGQHCSVFMAEVIDEAISQGEGISSIVAGLYDSVIQNYLNRVKGPRSIGKRIFCQGMPFSSDALAAAVTRQTGRPVVVPPNPGTIGAWGIALLARDQVGESLREGDGLDCRVFLNARVLAKETFVCRSSQGCGGSGNRCKIDRLVTSVNGVTQRFLWGGSCSLYDRGLGRRKLPDLSPDVFAAREALVDAVVGEPRANGHLPVVAMTDEFALKSVAPLMITFVRKLGFQPRVIRRATAATLRRGIEGALSPYCAPLQLYHGVFFEAVEQAADYLLIPMLKSLPRVGSEECAELCPMELASPDLLGNALTSATPAILRPVLEFDQDGYDGARFRRGMRALAEQLGALERFEAALTEATRVQRQFEHGCRALGEEALGYCRDNGVVPIAVLGRPYTIYNDVLNSNVPTILRGLGALPIPLDCLPVPDDVSVFELQYWAYTQRNLRAAEYVRSTPGLYAVFCSNYACGPDSFSLHFFSYVMKNKPFAVVETDGHSGDAGTKTRMEAFLYCVDSDLKSGASEQSARGDFAALDRQTTTWKETKEKNALIIIPRMGTAALLAAAALQAEGFRAEALPMTTRDDVQLGRQYTSGKECVPIMLTIGTALHRYQRASDPTEKFSYFMPTSRGPCRFGVYHSLHKIALEQSGFADRVAVLSPDESNYFQDMTTDFTARIWTGFVAHDLLQAMLFDVRPVETRPGAANAIFEKTLAELVACMGSASQKSTFHAIKELAGGMWGVKAVLGKAAREFARIKNRSRKIPTVAVVGEIYIRLDPFANDFVIDKLEARGLRARLAPFTEWLEYTTYLSENRVLEGNTVRGDGRWSIAITGLVQKTTYRVLYHLCQEALGWSAREKIGEVVEASKPYVHGELQGEAALSLGGPIVEYRRGHIAGVVVVGPHECMPSKIAEAQYAKAARDHGIPYLCVPLNGDPIDTELLDRFAYDIREQHKHRCNEVVSELF